MMFIQVKGYFDSTANDLHHKTVRDYVRGEIVDIYIADSRFLKENEAMRKEVARLGITKDVYFATVTAMSDNEIYLRNTAVCTILALLYILSGDLYRFIIGLNLG